MVVYCAVNILIVFFVNLDQENSLISNIFWHCVLNWKKNKLKKL